ncbi:MAG: hypothetical protein GX594_09555 [Pirellulaceae bacterium]|nr:hypothetical protein [Pirellulaceae bacterium]
MPRLPRIIPAAMTAALMFFNSLSAEPNALRQDVATLGPSLVVDRAARTFSFFDERKGGVGLREAAFGLEADGKLLRPSEAAELYWQGPGDGRATRDAPVELRMRFNRPKLEWTVRWSILPDGSVAKISSTIENIGSDGIKLRKCRLAEVSAERGEVVLGDLAERAVALLYSGWHNVGLPRRLAALAPGRTAKTLLQTYNPHSQTALQLGFLTFDRVNTEHRAVWNKEKAKLVVDSYCDFEGYELKPGAEVDSETLTLELSDDPIRSLENWASRAAEHYRPRIWPETPAGWVGWAWVDPFHVECYEDVVRRNAAAIEKKLSGLGVKYIWVSIGNLADHLPGNWLDWNQESFPTGPEKLVADLRRQGLTLGLWIAPFWISDHSPAERIERLRPAMLCRDGTLLQSNERWGMGPGHLLPPDKRPRMFLLDPTHPLVERHLRQVFAAYRQWGVRYYMIDFLYGISGSTPGTYRYDDYHDRSVISGPELYRRGLKIVSDAVGEDTYLLSSTGPTIQNVGLVDGARVGVDYGDGRPLTREDYFYPGTFVINNPAFWTSHRPATNAMATSFFLHRQLFLADSGNLLTLDKPCSLADAQISATIFGINGSPMMLGDDIDRMADERLAMVKKCLPRLPEAARSLDLFECPEPDYPKLFHLPVKTAWDRWDLVALFNYDSSPRTADVDLKRLGLDADGEYVVWDFWNERFDEVCRGKLRLTAGPQSVKLVRLSRRRPHPWLVSTDMHVRQGQAEIEDCSWDAATGTLRFRARRPAGERGNVFLLAPPGWEAAEPRGLWLAKDGRRASQALIVRCALDFSGKAVEKSVRFAPWKNQ